MLVKFFTFPRDPVVLSKHTTVSKLNNYSSKERCPQTPLFNSPTTVIVKCVHSNVYFRILRDRNLCITSHLVTITTVVYKLTK